MKTNLHFESMIKTTSETLRTMAIDKICVLGHEESAQDREQIRSMLTEILRYYEPSFAESELQMFDREVEEYRN